MTMVQDFDEQSASSASETDYAALHAATRHHGILMLLSWALLIPISISCSLLLRRQATSLLFFRVHYIIASLGMILAIAGWMDVNILKRCIIVIGSSQLSNKAYIHGVLGTVTMIISVVIVLMYPFMGKPSLDEQILRRSTMTAMIHRHVGYGIVVVSWITCYLGTRITWIYNDVFLLGLFLGCACLLVTLGLAYYKTTTSRRVESTTTFQQSEQQRLLPA